jgi:hypothetical protein
MDGDCVAYAHDMRYEYEHIRTQIRYGSTMEQDGHARSSDNTTMSWTVGFTISLLDSILMF